MSQETSLNIELIEGWDEDEIKMLKEDILKHKANSYLCFVSVYSDQLEISGKFDRDGVDQVIKNYLDLFKDQEWFEEDPEQMNTLVAHRIHEGKYEWADTEPMVIGEWKEIKIEKGK